MGNSYIDPNTVLSPRGSVQNLEVLYDGGAGSFSLARMEWDGRDAHGFRWNGYTDRKTGKVNKGSPISTGHPIWMILPTEMVQAMDFDAIINRKTLNQRVVSEIKALVETKKTQDPEGFSLTYEADANGIDCNVIEEIKEALMNDKINIISVKEKGSATLFNVAYS